MSGRGVSGRGAILRMLEESSEDASGSNDTQIGQGTFDSGLGTSRSVGRGRFLFDTPDEGDNEAKGLSSKQSVCSSISEGTSGNGSSILTKSTSGRGKILQFLEEEAHVGSKNIALPLTIEKSVDTVAERFEEVKIETDSEPVIRRGTKGW